jgi:hypothetical protein
MPAAAVLVAAMVDPVAALEDPFPYEGGGYYG